MTAREYAQTLQLLELHGIDAEPIGRHGGRSALGKARGELGRLGLLRRWARGRRFDLALAHGSHDLTLTARSLGIPSATTFDYEFAWLQHQLGCRAATRVVVPEAIPAERLARYGAKPPKLRRYPGLKEEYYLADFEPDASVPAQLGVDPARRLVVVRTPPEVSLYHRHGNPLFLAGARAARPRRARPRRRAPAHRRAARADPRPRPAVAARARPGGRRAEPDRRRRRGRLGRRNDEPRGGRARRPGLHDLRRPARRRGRAADPRRPAHAAPRRRRARPRRAAALPGRLRRDPTVLLDLLLAEGGGQVLFSTPG